MGYTGGEKKNPTYRSLGKHTESIQIDYDPSVISYADLLKLFWSSHNPCYKRGGRQYMSAIFYHDEKQKKLATETMKAEAAKRGKAVHTLILELETFYRAEDYHQKYYLRRRADLMKTFDAVFKKPIDFVDATASMRLNAYLGRHGSLDMVRKELKSYGLSESDTGKLEAMLGRLQGERKRR